MENKLPEQLKVSERHDSMRGWFAYYLHGKMRKNNKIWLITGDLGYGMFDRIQRDFPKRFINVGASEQSMVGIGVGMSMMGIIPVVYSITPFLLYRPFETIRNYINHEKIPVKLVGGGRDKDYDHDGFSHWAEEDKQVMNIFTNIKAYWPEQVNEVPSILDDFLENQLPSYLNLRRK